MKKVWCLILLLAIVPSMLFAGSYSCSLSAANTESEHYASYSSGSDRYIYVTCKARGETSWTGGWANTSTQWLNPLTTAACVNIFFKGTQWKSGSDSWCTTKDYPYIIADFTLVSYLDIAYDWTMIYK